MLGKLKILFLGDIIGRPGRNAMRKLLPGLVRKYSPVFIIANGENAAGGVGITQKIGEELLSYVDVLTSGNHIWDKKEALDYIDEEPGLLRPANYPEPCPGRADREIEKLREVTPVIFVDFHAEATSEKQALGWYLDGRVSALVGTHTHVQTADERILPNGTAYISDAGMVGCVNSVIGIRKDQGVQRFLTSRPQRFEPQKGDGILSAVYIEIDAESGKAYSIKRENLYEEKDGG